MCVVTNFRCRCKKPSSPIPSTARGFRVRPQFGLQVQMGYEVNKLGNEVNKLGKDFRGGLFVQPQGTEVILPNPDVCSRIVKSGASVAV